MSMIAGEERPEGFALAHRDLQLAGTTTVVARSTFR